MARKGENIYKRRDGRWEGRYFSGYKIDGKKMYSSVYAHTYRDVKAKLKTMKREAGATQIISFDNASKIWLERKCGRVKQSTLENYRYLLDRHINPYFGSIHMDKLNNGSINKFIDAKLANGRLRGNGGISRKYLHDMVSIIKSIVIFCEQEFEIPNRIRYANVPKYEAKEMEILSTEESCKLTKCVIADSSPLSIGILLSLYAGLRLGEVCGLCWEDVDFDEGLIYIRRTVQRISDGNGSTVLIEGTPKTIKSKRAIPLPDFILNRLNKMKKSDGYIMSGCSTRPEPAKLRSYLKKILKSCGVKQCRYHDLRHTFASNCIRLQFDIKSLSEILGHSTVNMTLNRYVHSSVELKRQYMNLLKI